jgi:glutathione S-transferase
MRLSCRSAITIWESLAILEYAAERAPEAQLWPDDPAARALARAVSAEMHGGFQALRQAMPMNIRATAPADKAAARLALPGVQDDVNRIQAIWRDCRRRFGPSSQSGSGQLGSGPLLFGAFTNADAMFAPVATRFKTYGVPLDQDAADYVAAVFAIPEMAEWVAAAADEPWLMPRNEL